MKKLFAYKNYPELKKILLAEVAKHREADQIIKGTYGMESNGEWKGCAVGCAIHSLNTKLGRNYETNDHTVYETELGIPQTIAYLEDAIFEGLPEKQAKLWPERFLESITPGADLSLVIPKLMVWLMNDIQQFQYAGDEFDVITCLETVAQLYQRIIDGGIVTDIEWGGAARAAWADARATRAAEAAKYKIVADKLVEILEATK